MLVRRKLSLYFLLLLSALLLASCTTPYRSPVVRYVDGESRKVAGVKQLLHDSIKNEVDIITVHGMCWHDAKWALDSINDLSEQLGQERLTAISGIEVKDSQAIVYKRRFEYGKGKFVNISAIVWSPILSGLKKGLCYDQTKKTGSCAESGASPYVEQRATLNRIAKDSLMDDCLADAMAYQGKAKDGISKQMQEAILAAATVEIDSPAPKELRDRAKARTKIPLVIFTSSLGSKITFDAIDGLSERSDDEGAAKATFSRTKIIFMAANQWPILHLADLTLDETKSTAAADKSNDIVTPNDSLQHLLDKYRKGVEEFQGAAFLPNSTTAVEKSERPTIVVLSDPNDLLSYSWCNAKPKPAYVSVDVVVSNEKTWFNLIENPATAHRGYLAQPYIADLVMNGHTEDPKAAKHGCPKSE